MKESEHIREEMLKDNSDNDYRDINYLRKIERAERKESFEEKILPLIKARYSVEIRENSFEIITEKYGRIILYPKANSLLLVKYNSWIKHFAINWITKWILK